MSTLKNGLTIFSLSMEKTKKISVKLVAADIAECALFVALMTAGANISIPFFPVPLTFQTVLSVLAGLLLGWRKGAISMAVYCAAGLIGIPVLPTSAEELPTF